MGYKHNKIEKHPLRDAYMVINTTLPFIPPFIGTKRECEEAIIAAEKSTEDYIKNNKMQR